MKRIIFILAATLLAVSANAQKTTLSTEITSGKYSTMTMNCNLITVLQEDIETGSRSGYLRVFLGGSGIMDINAIKREELDKLVTFLNYGKNKLIQTTPENTTMAYFSAASECSVQFTYDTMAIKKNWAIVIKTNYIEKAAAISLGVKELDSLIKCIEDSIAQIDSFVSK